MYREDIVELFNNYVIGNYTRSKLSVVKAKGSWVWSEDGKMYLDFFPGWAVSGLGHCHPRVVKAIRSQVNKVIHVPNNYYNALQGKLAKSISLNSFNGKVFFCNSGAEANEAAFKLIRLFGSPRRYEIISMRDSFHGRTLACTAATGQDKLHLGIGPLPQGFKSVPFNDRQALVEAVTDKTAAVIIELIQGEGGIRVADRDYVTFLRDFCNQKNILLVFDEVQTGMGRTGQMFCYQNYGIEPDIMTLAKSLGGGVPIGAMVTQKKISGILVKGMHASTFGGSPFACAAGLAVFEAIKKERLLLNAQQMGDYLRGELLRLRSKYPVIKEVRGMGLMIGVELIVGAQKVADYCFSKKLLINCTQKKVLRIMPALTVKKQEIDQAMEILDTAIAKS